MKREGRPHGMVRTCTILPSPWNPRPDNRFNKFDSRPTAGLFTKVQPKPTNHSKFTGKCGKARCTECHMNPCCKSKGKTKGNQKVKSHDVVSNMRLMTWRVVDGRGGSNFSGLSATRMLDHLGNDEHLDDDHVYDHDDHDHDSRLEEVNQGFVDDDENCVNEIEEEKEEEEDDDDGMSYCDVGFALDQVEGDEDWCLVAEL